MATIKQLKIGTTNYDIKALNATNNNTADFVVRDIKYGTAAPSGGSAGQVYLQYSTDTSDNPYVYAEDTLGEGLNTADLYYTKNEMASLMTPTEFYFTGSTGTNSTNYFYQISGDGWINISATTTMGTGATSENYGIMNAAISRSTDGGSNYVEIARNEWRKHGSGYMIAPSSSCSLACVVHNGDRIRISSDKSFDGTKYYRFLFLCFNGCSVSAI